VGATTQTRTRMVTSAALLLREHGVAGTSIARVLQHSRGPRGSVQFHFPGGKAELLTEALVWAGGLVTAVLSEAGARGATPAEVVNEICEHYKHQLAGSDFRADPGLGATVAGVIDGWTTGLAAVLTAAGHSEAEATDLADLCIAAIEGAITLCRVQRSTRPLEIVQQRLVPLL